MECSYSKQWRWQDGNIQTRRDPSLALHLSLLLLDYRHPHYVQLIIPFDMSHLVSWINLVVLSVNLFPNTSVSDLPVHASTTRDVNETLAYETETRPRHSVFGPRRDQGQDLPAIPQDRDETETSDFCHETRPRPRPCKAESETFFETFKVEHWCTQIPLFIGIEIVSVPPMHSWRNRTHKLWCSTAWRTDKQAGKQTDRQKNSTFFSAPAPPEIRAPPNLPWW